MNAASLLFSDDFSTDKGWVDESNGYIYRDPTNEWLVWDVTRSDTRRYYYPIDAMADPIQLDFRFNVTGASGNGMVWIGLTERIEYPGSAWPGVGATGVFVGLGRDMGLWPNYWAAMIEKYEDGSSVLNNRINYGSLNQWRRLSLVVENNEYTMTVWDDSDNQLDQITGPLSGDHSTYQYIMVVFDGTGGWESQQGYFDEIMITGNPMLNEVVIDIKPGTENNSINSKNKGVIPIAILTTEDFDATTVDASSVLFGPNGATKEHKQDHIQDIDDDGDLDMLLHFRTQDTGIQCGDTSASLTGQTVGGQPFEGSDTVNTVRCK